MARSNPLSGRHPLETRRPDRVAQRKRGQAPAAAELDRLIHERMRLGIVSALAANESLSFHDLKKLARHYGRQPERPRAQTRGSKIHRVREVL